MPKLRPAEVLTLVYFGIIAALFCTLGENYPIVGGCVLVSALLLALARAGERLRGLRGLRFAYPLLTMPFMYEAASETVLLIHGRYVDEAVNAWEKSFFGEYPNVAIGALHSPLMTEFVTFCYFSYYGCFLLPLVFYARGRKPLAERYLFNCLLALLICYLGFMFVPLAGPATALPREFLDGHPDGYLISDLQNAIMAAFDPPGTCFPSPHVAGAWITLLCLRPHVSAWSRRALWVLTIGLTVAVVYDWYHYLSDAVAGLLVALLVHGVTTLAGKSGTSSTAHTHRPADTGSRPGCPPVSSPARTR